MAAPPPEVRSRRAASMPFRPGIVMSRITASGRRRAASREQRLPVADGPHDFVVRFQQSRDDREKVRMVIGQHNTRSAQMLLPHSDVSGRARRRRNTGGARRGETSRRERGPATGKSDRGPAGRGGGLQGDEPAPEGELNQLGAGLDAEFRHHAVLVKGDGSRRDLEGASDLLHRETFGQQPQHVAAASGQLAIRGEGGGRGAGVRPAPRPASGVTYDRPRNTSRMAWRSSEAAEFLSR